MIDTLIKLLDHLTQFLKYRKEAEEKLFDKIINPVFENLQTIHEDYLQMFEWCWYELAKGTDISLIAERLMKDRLEQEALRQSILAFINIYLKDKRLSKYERFFRATEYYFWESDFNQHRQGTRSSWLLSAMREWAIEEKKEALLIWQEGESAAAGREILMGMLNKSLYDIRIAWTNVSERYAALLTQPQSIILKR